MAWFDRYHAVTRLVSRWMSGPHRLNMMSWTLMSEPLESRKLLTTFVVTSIDDVVQVDGQVSLREAILAANQNATIGDAPAGSVGLDEITFASTDNIGVHLTHGPLTITDDLTIWGPSAGALILDTNTQHEHFQVANSRFRLERAVLQNSHRAADPIDRSGGGSVLGRDSRLEFRDVEFVNCTSTGDGGAMYVDDGSLILSRVSFTECSGLNGGAVYLAVSADANPWIEDSEFNFNHAQGRGGAVYLAVTGSQGTFSHCRFSNNSADLGGAVYVVDHQASLHPVEFTQSDFRNNSARRRGGAISAEDTRLIVHTCLLAENLAADPDQSNRGDGGAIYLRGGERSQLNASSFLANEAERNGGAIFIDQNKEVGSHFSVYVGNRAWGEVGLNGGGAVFNNRGILRMNTARFTGNSSPGEHGAGGAIFSWGGLISTSATCAFELNWAMRSGGAMELVDGDLRLSANFGSANLPARGNFVRSSPPGGLSYRTGGALNVTSVNRACNVLFGPCSFFDNSAEFGGAVFVGATSVVNFRWGSSALGRNSALQYGGAIYAEGTIEFDVPTTLADNQAGLQGGAIFLSSSSTLLHGANATFANNSPDDIFQE